MIDALQATDDRSSIDQTSYGVGLQATSLAPLFSKKNQFVIGVSADTRATGKSHREYSAP